MRVIMNSTASNVIFLPFAGDIASLPYVGHWRTIILHGGEVVVWSSEDLKGCFYLLLMPRAWAPFFAFDEEYSCAELGLAMGKDVTPPTGGFEAFAPVPLDDHSRWLGAITLPMGWRNAMGLAQYVHRRWTQLTVGDPLAAHQRLGLPLAREMRKDRVAPYVSAELERLRAIWQTYCDDLDIIEVYEDLDAALLVTDTVHEWHAAIHDMYDEWKAVVSAGKAHTRVLEVKRLGAWSNGVAGRIGPSGERCGDMAGFTLFLLGGRTCSHKALQVAAGHCTNLFQYRKEVSCTLNRVWRVLVKWGGARVGVHCPTWCAVSCWKR